MKVTTPLNLVELYLYSFTCLSVCMWAAVPFTFTKYILVVMTYICMLNCFIYTVNTIFLLLLKILTFSYTL
jgi:hypothetical protein